MKTTIFLGRGLKVFSLSLSLSLSLMLSVSAHAQNYDHYYLEIKDGYELGEVTKTTNPASSQVTVNYEIDGSSSAYLMVVNTQTGSSDNYILDTTTVNTSIDVSAFETGLYNIILVCDGATQNAKTLLKQ